MITLTGHWWLLALGCGSAVLVDNFMGLRNSELEVGVTMLLQLKLQIV